MKAAWRFRVPDDVVRLIRGLHPELKHKVRNALGLLGRDAHAGKALQAELQELRSVRAGRFRVVYKIGARRIVEVIAVGPREKIYEETMRLIKKSSKAEGK